MHILLIHQAFAALDEPGGTRHHELARELVAHGHRVTVLTGQVSYMTGERLAHGWVHRETDELGVSIWRCYTYPAWHRSFVHRLVSFISFMFSSFVNSVWVREVDLVWGTTPPIFQGFTAWLIARLKRVPFLFEVRDLWPYFAIAVGVLKQPILIRLSEWLERFLYRRADRIVVNSPGFVDHVQARGGRIVELVPNGVDVSMFDPSPEDVKYRCSWGLEDHFIAVYAGAHGISNDLGILLEAAERLRDHPEISLVLLGDGKEKPSLVAYAQEMGLANIHFLPVVPKEEIPCALAAADACIAILKPIEAYKMTYPNKVFDYMAAGRPIVLAIDGVIREVVEDAGAGIWVKPGDPDALANAVLHLAENRELGRRMGLAGRAYVLEHFNRPELAHRMTCTMEAMVQRLGDSA